MFAAATREVVFSNPAVVQQVNQNFVPVALKAAHVNNPPSGVEGRLYAEIGRSKPAPQGICVANSAGKALVWALSFDDDESIVDFLEYAAEKYRQFPDASQPVSTERFMRYPSHKLSDVADTAAQLVIPESHAESDRCPGQPNVASDTLVGRVLGRALDKDGRPLAETHRQEHYLEARFEIPGYIQQKLVTAARKADGERFQLPDEFVRAIVEPAYLGQLDVNPWGVHPDSQNDHLSWSFFGEQIVGEKGSPIQIRITGESNVAGWQQRGVWEHAVQLEWQGVVQIDGDRIHQLTLWAEGHERLRWGHARLELNREPDASHLMAGHPIDLDGGVQYGLRDER